MHFSDIKTRYLEKRFNLTEMDQDQAVSVLLFIYELIAGWVKTIYDKNPDSKYHDYFSPAVSFSIEIAKQYFGYAGDDSSVIFH